MNGILTENPKTWNKHKESKEKLQASLEKQ